jgi:hypothetical protein
MYSYAVRDLQITQLSDEFGQSIIYLRCDCEYPSPQSPHTLAAVAGWDADLQTLGCGACGVRSAMSENGEVRTVDGTPVIVRAQTVLGLPA